MNTEIRKSDVRGQGSGVKRPPLRGGFTLIEVILVMGIMAIIATYSLVNITGNRPQRVLNAAVLGVATNLRGAMENSRAQKDSSQWWVRFVNPTGGDDNDYYSVCSGTYSGTPGSSCATEGGVETSRTALLGDVYFTLPASGATINVVFQKSTGLPTAQSTITLNVGNLQQQIIVNTNGRIDS